MRRSVVFHPLGAIGRIQKGILKPFSTSRVRQDHIPMRRIRRRIRVFVPYVWEQDFVRVSMRTSVAPGELGARPSVRIDGRRGIVAGALPKPFGSANITLFVAPLCRESRREFDKGFGQRRTTKGFGSQPVWPLGSGGRDAIPSYMSEVEERYRWRLVTQQPVGLQEQSPVQAGCAAQRSRPRRAGSHAVTPNPSSL